jgi:hypothetical protein
MVTAPLDAFKEPIVIDGQTAEPYPVPSAED